MTESERKYILFLPPITSFISFQHLKAVYGPSLAVLFSDLLSAVPKSTHIVVDIALACPYLCGTRPIPRSKLFDKTQADLSTLYTLISILLTELDDAVETDRIDARVILLSHANDVENEDRKPCTWKRPVHGPVIDMPSLAQSGSQWQMVYSIESMDGEQLLDRFLCYCPDIRVKRVGTSHSQLSEEPCVQSWFKQGGKRHNSVAVGGTFDHLHVGHKLLLTMTAFVLDYPESDKLNEERLITIGITGDKLLKNKKFSSVLEPWHLRQLKVRDFLQSILCFQPSADSHIQSEETSSESQDGHEVRVRLSPVLALRCVELKDPFGPTVHDESISALVISAETESGAQAINLQRTQKGWVPLDVYRVNIVEPLQQAHDSNENPKEVNHDFQGKISSTDIRKRIFEREAQNSHNPNQ